MSFQTGKLRVLMQEMANLTLPECQTSCLAPLSCCDELYCQISIVYADKVYNIKLIPDETQAIPMMGPNGCRVEPYLRPLCTLHTCAVNSFGFKPGDEKWTEEYFELRDKCEEAMFGDDYGNVETEFAGIT